MKRLFKLFVPILMLILFTSAKNGASIEFMLPVNINNGMVVGTVIASDPDYGQTLTYKILSGNTNTSFKIAAATGVVTVNNATYINARHKAYYDLIVQVTDLGGWDKDHKWVRLSARATVRITKMS